MADATRRRVLITGAGSGFGKGAALELARRGHAVIASCETGSTGGPVGLGRPTGSGQW